MTEGITSGISFEDIQNAVAIIDYAADQGAFKGWETINKVAGVRIKLAAFVEAVAAAQKAEEEAKAEAAAEAEIVPETEDAEVLAPGA